ncbi:hypothetical protein [Streptomyces collinus]|uniref:hypothetical protein n=1 Tax=Streptomyces collinus TaxID=42684 RepID=UPI0038153C2A
MKRMATVAAAAAAAFTLLTSQASAIDWEHDVATATTTSSPGPWQVRGNIFVSGLFAKNGDWFEVNDLEADDQSAFVMWELRNDSGVLVRGGKIWMTKGNGEGRYQNKNFTEGYNLKWRACAGDYGATWYDAFTCTEYAYTEV